MAQANVARYSCRRAATHDHPLTQLQLERGNNGLGAQVLNREVARVGLCSSHPTCPECLWLAGLCAFVALFGIPSCRMMHRLEPLRRSALPWPAGPARKQAMFF
jgi:hypothetical protein